MKRDDILLLEIESRILRIQGHLKGIRTQEKFLRDELRKSAVVRKLEVIGEAANKLQPEVRSKYPMIPWAQMIGLRNRLIHGYFDVDHSIVWEVTQNELPRLLIQIRDMFLEIAPPVHPWRSCPLGYSSVRLHSRSIPTSKSHPDGKTRVREHCRRNPTGKDQLYPDEIKEVFENAKNGINTNLIAKLSAPSTANDFDREILTWTKYWNDIFTTSVPLEAEIVKALLGSESSFKKDVKDMRASKGNLGRGLFQITDQTRKTLADEKGELSDHYVHLTAADAKNPALAACASIRWLFYKRQWASKKLNRDASWEEAIAAYKGYMNPKTGKVDEKKLDPYREWLGKLK